MDFHLLLRMVLGLDVCKCHSFPSMLAQLLECTPRLLSSSQAAAQ